jgi:hypothetical protein
LAGGGGRLSACFKTGKDYSIPDHNGISLHLSGIILK